MIRWLWQRLRRRRAHVPRLYPVRLFPIVVDERGCLVPTLGRVVVR